MGTTTNGLAYAELSDAANGPGGFQALAVSVDARYGLTVAAFSDLAGIATPFSGMTVWVTADLTAYVYNGTTWVPTSGKQHVYTTAPIATPLSSTAFSDVAGWTFNTVPGIYAFDLKLFLLNAGSSAVDMKFGFTWTGTGTMSWGMIAPTAGVDSPDYSGPANFIVVHDVSSSPANTAAGVGTPAGITVRADLAGTFECTDPGVVQLQFAQFASDGTYPGQITHGSRMVAERIGA